MTKKPFIYMHDLVADIVRSAAFEHAPSAVHVQDYYWNGACFAAGDVWLDADNGGWPRPLRDVLEEWLAAVDAGAYDAGFDTSTPEGRRRRDVEVAVEITFTIDNAQHEHAYIRAKVLLSAATARRLLREHSDRNSKGE